MTEKKTEKKTPAGTPHKYRRVEGVVTAADLAYARRQDRYGCAIVRAIQRTLPEATYVMVEKNKIRLSMEEDGYRYEFETPRELVQQVIKPFDQGEDVKADIPFALDVATNAWPIMRQTAQQKTENRRSMSPNQRTSRRQLRDESRNRNVRAIGRFADSEDEVKEDGE
jgi:hypothetical protein